MTATSTDSEISAVIENLGFRSKPVILKCSPVQNNLKFVSLKRPPNVTGADGVEDMNGVWHAGYLALLKILILDTFISRVQTGKENKKALIFCR